ncbi:MAG: hypothetical protein ACHQ2Z_15315, partial [Elusimicrobiota bacterium]
KRAPQLPLGSEVEQRQALVALGNGGFAHFFILSFRRAMKFLSLRWIFLLAAVAGAARCIFFDPAAPEFGFYVVCGLLWFALSRRKVHSLDRESLGFPPRR